MVLVNLTPEPKKRCTKCHAMVPLWHFSKHKGCSDGLRPDCKGCQSRRWKKRYARDREKLIAYQKDYYSKNAEKVKANHRRRYRDDPVYNFACKASAKDGRPEWYKRRQRNPVTLCADRIRVRLATILRGRGYKKKSRTFDRLGYTQTDLWNHLRSDLGKPCALCGFMLTRQNSEIDHITPLSTAKTEEEVWKLNALANLRLICADCNRRRPRDGSDLEASNGPE